jgi:ArsR family transcriptional regulator, virulence genes transcriptional regulator
MNGDHPMGLPKPVEPMQPAMDIEQMAESAREASEFLKALAHESRLLILCNLLEGEKSVGKLEEFLSLRQSTVSQQLARLRLEGLVAARRDGKTIYYSIANDKVRAVIDVLYRSFCDVKPSRAARVS